VRVEVTSSADVAVTQAAGVDVYPDQIHSVAPYTSAVTEYNITVKNTGNGADTFNISLASVAYNPSGASHEWTIEGSFWGTFLGSLIVGQVYALGILVLPRLSLVFIYVLMALVLILRPWGLLGRPLQR
ncbi:MAG: hypothetical protein JSU70_11125, partial [Phycisphaerales bacterium]